VIDFLFYPASIAVISKDLQKVGYSAYERVEKIVYEKEGLKDYGRS
jgi:hypothetical protein